MYVQTGKNNARLVTRATVEATTTSTSVPTTTTTATTTTRTAAAHRKHRLILSITVQVRNCSPLFPTFPQTTTTPHPSTVKATTTATATATGSATGSATATTTTAAAHRQHPQHDDNVITTSNSIFQSIGQGVVTC